jgi:small subunit ribosomal protein S17
MQDENENNQAADQQADQPVAEGEAAEPEAEQPAAEGAAEAPPAGQPAEEPAAAPAEEAEQLSPKQRRRLARSRAGVARPERSTEERVGERAEARRQKAAERSRWRAKQKEKKGRDRASTAAGLPQDEVGGAAAEPGKRKVRQGVVVSSKGDKTITVRIDAVRRHRVYGKVVRESTTLHAHDESNEAGEGDLVRVVESRPLSRTKRWRLVDVLEKAR